MKRGVAFLFVWVFLVVNAGCSAFDYDGWNSLYIDSCGTLKIPKEWTSYEKDGLIYIVDENTNPIMIETHSYSGFEENDQGDVESNDFFDEVRSLRLLSSSGLSNGAVYGKVLVEKNSTQCQQFFLELFGEPIVTFIIWDETVDEELVKTIAASFSRTGDGSLS